MSEPGREGRWWHRVGKNEDCQKPYDLWHSRTKGSTEIEVQEFIYGLIRALQPLLVVETGSQWGYTARVIGEALKRNGRGRLFTLEVDEKRYKYTARRCRNLERVMAVRTSSLDWQPPEPIDLIYFDTELEVTKREFSYFLPWFHVGTVYLWHDTGTHNSLRGWLNEQRGTVKVHLPTPRGITIGRAVGSA